MKRKFLIKMIVRCELKIEGRLILFASSRQKARKKFKRLFPRYKIILIKEYSSGDDASGYD